jgi:serine/threonine protein kinase
LTDPQQKLDLRCGTSFYMPPEIVRNAPYLGIPADTWSLGVLLFTITNGYYPFGDKKSSDEETFKAILVGNLKFAKQCSLSLQNLLMMLLRQDPQARMLLQNVEKHPWFKEEQYDFKNFLKNTQMEVEKRYSPSPTKIKGKKEERIESIEES